MKSVQRGIRDGDIERDSFGRLTCNHCEARLKTENHPERLNARKFCPDCGRKWKELR